MGCVWCKRDYEVEEERKPLLEGGENPPQYVGPKLAPTKDSDDGFFVLNHEPSKNVEILSLESKDELDGSLNPVRTTPSPSQMLMSAQDKTVAFSVPNSSVMEDRSYQPVAQMPTSPAHQISLPDVVSTKVLPEADLPKSAMSTGIHTLDLPSSSHAGIAATVHNDIETDQVGSLSLTRTAIIALDTEQSDSDAAATGVTCTADSLADAMYDDTTPLLSTTAQSTREDPVETSNGPEQCSHHEQPAGGTVMQSLFFSEEDDSVQGSFRDSAVLSSQLTSTGYHSMSSEAEPQTAATSYTGGVQSDAEISETETENQTTSAGEPEILEDGTKDQTTATSYTGGSQSDAELSAIDTGNQIATVSDTLGDVEMTVVETENQTTAASYTGGVRNDAEVSNIDLPDSGSKEDLDGALLLQDDETKRLSGSYANGTTKEAALSVAEMQATATIYTGGIQRDAEILEEESQTSTVDAEISVDDTKGQTTATSYTGGVQSDAEITETEPENQTTSAVEAEISEDGTKDQTTAISHTGCSQSDAEISAIDPESQIATVRETLDVNETLDDAEMTVENQTTPTSYTDGVQNNAEVSKLNLPDSCSGSKEDLDGVPLLQDDETKPMLESLTNGTTKEASLRDSMVLSSQLTSIGYHSMSSEAEPKTAATSYTGGVQSDDEISEIETENQTTSAGEPEILEDGTKDQTTATSYIGEIESNVEILESETENRTISAVEAEISEGGTKDQTTAISHTGGSQSDAELSAVDTEIQISTVSDTLGDAEMTVVETDNQTTAASYTGGVQNDAEVSNFDLPDSGSKEDLDGALLLQDDETKHLSGGHTNGTTKEAAFTPQSLDSVDISLKRKWHDHLRTRVNLLKMPGSSLHREFDALKTKSAHEVQYTTAQNQANSSKNRPAAPVPPDTNAMVKLQSLYCAEDFDYINGCYVGSPSHPRAYIVTQTPMGNTVGDFWRMVWEQCASVIVLLTQKMEHLGGLNPKFWPEKGITNYYGLIQSGNWMTGSLSVRTTREVKDRHIKDLVTRHIELRTEHPVTFSEVELYHYLGWPHHGTARSHKDVVLLLNRVLETREYRPEKFQAECPVIVVSTHGAGRAGCFSAIAVAHELMTAPQENPSCWTRGDHILDEVVQGLRECRSGLVEDRFQFEFCHQVLFEALTAPKGDSSPAKRRKADHKQEARSKKKGHAQKKKLSVN